MIQRLEQILILRKLGISIKDIKRIFSASGSEIVPWIIETKSEVLPAFPFGEYITERGRRYSVFCQIICFYFPGGVWYNVLIRTCRT